MVDIMRVRAVSTGYSGGPGVSTFYFGVAVPPLNDPAAVLACNRVRDAFVAAKNLWPNTWSVTVDAAVETIDEVDGGLTGTLSGATSTTVGGPDPTGFGAAPTGIEVRYFTPGVVDGKRVRGRTYLVPLGNIYQQNDGTPAASAITLGNAFGVAMRNAGATDCVFGVWHRPLFSGKGSTRVLERPGKFVGANASDCPDKFVVLRSRRD